MSRVRRATAAAAVTAAAIGALAASGPATALPSPTQRVDLEVLLVSADGSEPGFAAWKQELDRQGTPYDAIVASTAPAITTAQLQASTTRARYQAVIFAGDSVTATLDPAELTAIRTFERTFGMREIVTYAFPTADEGVAFTGSFGPMETLGTEASLTDAGRAAFPDLAGAVTYEKFAFGYGATAAPGAQYTSFVNLPNGESVLGVYRRPDGVEQMVSTVAVGSDQVHGGVLLRSMLDWVTFGVRLGNQRSYLAFHVDDIFSKNDRWDVDGNFTPIDEGNCSRDGSLPLPPCSTSLIRMTPADVTRAAAWSRANVPLDMVFNGAGMDEHVAANGSDPTGDALIANRAAFRWVNHTYSHQNLNTSTVAEIVREINDNISFAIRKGLPIDRDELVTGEHSGLANPNMATAAAQTGVDLLGSDNSRQPQPYAIGRARTVPRHPSNVYYNVGTFAEQLDEYNYIYFENCTNTAVTTCLTRPATWDEYVQSETTIMLRHVLGNDPRPHYVHAANLAEDGTLYPVADRVIASYRRWFRPPLVTPTMTEANTEFLRRDSWRSTVGGGRLTAYRLGSRVYMNRNAFTLSTVPVPVTGVTATGSYGARRSGWINLGGVFTYNYVIG